MSASPDFTVVSRAGLTQDEFAVAAEVSRVTVNSWVNGKMRPHRYIRERIEQLLWQMESAVAAGDLPLPAGTSKEARRESLAQAITRAQVRLRYGALNLLSELNDLIDY